MSTEDVDRRKHELARALRRRAAELATEPAPTGGGLGAGCLQPGAGGPDRVAFFASSRLRSALLAPLTTADVSAA